MDAKVLHIIAAVLTVLSWIFQIVAMAGTTAMWSSDLQGVNVAKSEGCGLFSCSGPAVCSCYPTGCTSCAFADPCSDKVTDGHCEDLAGHISVAEAFSVVGIMALSLACLLCILKLTPVASKVPEGCMNTLQCVHIAAAIVSLITFALVAAAYDKEFCGCKVKSSSTLSYGFAFLVINFVFQIIAAVLAGAGQAMEGGGTGDYNSYSS
eukprot:TRINITY_DN17728_c0_g1_i1.p1 TRINITY_DN17728_c0_g1~~TRINITY_DN17728_c0_g1_i1.p1  ORF type:complete len:208 (+),score=52.18 TRINITY_DN17728_c0_g1_i1:48-671(+)